MPQLNGTGPNGDTPRSGRKLGKCSKASNDQKAIQLGKGMGKRRKSGGGKGKGKRLQSGLK